MSLNSIDITSITSPHGIYEGIYHFIASFAALFENKDLGYLEQNIFS